MKVVQINAYEKTGSTGKICMAINELLEANGDEGYILYVMGEKSDAKRNIKYASNIEIYFQAFMAKLLGNYGFNSRLITSRLIKELDRITPDVVHLHNIHTHNANLKMLFSYLKKNGIKVVWTFHDCWAFTGYCTHFDGVGCDKWEHNCGKCPQANTYSWVFDKSALLQDTKKDLYENYSFSVVTPSEWLGEIVSKSFLSNNTISVINNGIDLNIFKPTNKEFRKKIGNDKRIVLGVSFNWNAKKGLDAFIELRNLLNSSYIIVLVGLSNDMASSLPEGIIPINKTNNQQELADIYSSADVYVNPTLEDTYPTVNMEAIACGTPVVTYATGGAPEILGGNCGVSVEKGNVSALKAAIEKVCDDHEYYEKACEVRAKDFNQMNAFKKYIDLYKAL
ncbi:Glycosyltransferase involved in cell wall bisynthesis [Pseudobutyrivibrio sp. UC1225]|uniref:glycosyltransferase n=1 Tax=Pseudobutyrivibrio sp. UC1225 TaxID=1798185 RepID=UPI0008F0DD8E|nr:glycosyltransferase [Pseudobutyrivibrio sp. UC1225]SFN78506.1 Glycosyltransferase involved in cell wall bisynthesis [Pseudobutyrivibrio sp. UC1225]